jgi:hypothetical protein
VVKLVLTVDTDVSAGLANNAAVAFEVQLQQSFAPLVAMAAMIHVQPYYPTLAQRFDEIAAELIAQVCGAINLVCTALKHCHEMSAGSWV